MSTVPRWWHCSRCLAHWYDVSDDVCFLCGNRATGGQMPQFRGSASMESAEGLLVL